MTRRAFTILFQGDSITDAGRDRGSRQRNDPVAMGRGYAYLAMCRLLADRPGSGLCVYNRGISGNRVPDLSARWSDDCVALQPDVLSILIGVNDLWHKMEGRSSGTVAEYESGYAELLEQTRRALPKTALVLCEPFALRCGAVTERWFPEFDERRAVAARLAQRSGAAFVPFQDIFERAVLAGAPPEYWAADGVHPTPQGHQLMADAWLAAVRPLLSGD
jgi:lysophospholipase L1-like esterase